MSEGLTRIDPVEATAVNRHGVTVALAPAATRFSLRGEAGDLSPFTSCPLPERIGDLGFAGDALAIKLGPDEWLLIGAVDGRGDGRPVSIVEVSDRQLGLDVEGPGAAELLMAGCPLDLARMKVGRGTRTIYETVEVVIIKHAPDRFHVEVWRSFAPWLWLALTTG